MQHKPVRIGPQREEAPRLCCVRLDDYAPVQTSDQLPHALSGNRRPTWSRSCAITIAAATIRPPSSSWRRASTLTATPCAGLSTSWLSAAGFQRRQGVGVLVLMRPIDYPLNAQARFSQNLLEQGQRSHQRKAAIGAAPRQRPCRRSLWHQ